MYLVDPRITTDPHGVCLYRMFLFHLVLEISQSSVWLRKNIPEKAEI